MQKPIEYYILPRYRYLQYDINKLISPYKKNITKAICIKNAFLSWTLIVLVNYLISIRHSVL